VNAVRSESPEISHHGSRPLGKRAERIDGIVALIMAIGRTLGAREEPQPSYRISVF
jgi:hypothetical protein